MKKNRGILLYFLVLATVYIAGMLNIFGQSGIIVNGHLMHTDSASIEVYSRGELILTRVVGTPYVIELPYRSSYTIEFNADRKRKTIWLIEATDGLILEADLNFRKKKKDMIAYPHHRKKKMIFVYLRRKSNAKF